jgi:hypothetical protein
MNDMSLIALGVALFAGAALVLAAIVGYFKKGDVPTILVLSGVALIALPGASSIKLGPDGVEISNRNELLALKAQLGETSSGTPSASGGGSKSAAAIPARKKIALVFFADKASGTADNVLAQLREAGFLASSASTDFSELGLERFRYSHGDAYIRYTSQFREDATRTEALLKEAGVAKVELIEAQRLTGAIQVGLF